MQTRHIRTAPTVVGYGQVTDEGATATGVGAIFFPVGNVETGAEFDLLSMEIPGNEDATMIPDLEYLRYLNPESTATRERYTYVSKQWIIDNVSDDWEEYVGAIGWWFFNDDEETGWIIEDCVNDKDYEHKVKTPQMFPVGTAFMGSFLRNELALKSSGEVPLVTTAFNDGGNTAPLFMNYLPVEIDLSDVAVPGSEDATMIPDLEYLRYLDPESTATKERYTYVSKQWIIDNVSDDWEEYSDAIGWWFFNDDSETGWVIEDCVNEKDYEHKVKTAIPLRPGYAFMGNFLRNELDVMFPGATSVPSKQ